MVGTMTLDIGSFLTAHPALISDIAGHALAHALYSYVRRGSRGRGMSRRQMRKLANRRHRWFVDNIIMHHKRLHDRNRSMIISNARTRALARRDAAKREQVNLQRSVEIKKDDGRSRWRNQISLKEKGLELRGRADSRRLRARSRWLTVMESAVTA